MSAPSTEALASHLIATADASPDSAALLASMMMDRMRWKGDGTAPVVLDGSGNPALDATGQPKTAVILLDDFRRELPMMFTSAKPSAPTVAARLGVTGLTARAAAEHAAAKQRQASGEPANPWAKTTHNLTQQVLMEKNNPALAARMKAAAGV